MKWQDIPGNSRDIELVYDPAVAEAKDGDVFVELGVFYGRSLAMLATLARNAGKRLNILGVDQWEKAGDITRSATHGYEPATVDACVRNLAEYLETKELCLVISDTAHEAEAHTDARCALVFIDGDHSYEGCKRDIEAWMPKVRSGGILAGHDFTAEYPGVVQAVNELVPGAEARGICWWWRKP